MKKFELPEINKPGTGFKTPDGYFDSLDEKILGRIESEPKVFKLSSKRNWFIAAAAVMVLALTIPTLNQLSETPNQPDVAAIENYLARNSASEDLVDLLDQEDIETINMEYSIEESALEDILTSEGDLPHLIK